MKTAKEIGIAGAIVALLISLQLVLSGVAGVELVTVITVSYAYYFGVKRALITNLSYSLLRCFVFGFSPNVIVLYIVYYCLIALFFGFLGKKLGANVTLKKLVVIVILSCLFTALFTVLDNLITPLITGMSLNGFKVYFLSSLPVMGVGVINACVTVSLLFYPLLKLYSSVYPSN
ncbi:MAG: hypothetical protein IKL82_02720 [Clostridia bacterium]|nr:hypothetical protein [Clostridia bacterium]